MFDPTSPLTVSSLILLLISGNTAQWLEIRRLNRERLKDMKEIGTEDRKVIQGSTRAIKNLVAKIDNIGRERAPQ